MYSLNISKKEIGRAGERLAICSKNNTTLSEDDLNILHSWRMLHLYPLTKITEYLTREANIINLNCLVSSRIKRLPSIISKLQRFEEMKLNKMQDLGGCRAILSNLDEVYRAYENIKKLKFKHQLIRTDDYMADVKESGYRSLHLIYSFKNEKYENLNGLRIEMQLRTSIQHSWATAVEMVGLFRKESLKSSFGNPDWLRFFELVSELFYRIESGESVGRYMKISEDLKKLTVKLNVFMILEAYNKAASHIDSSENYTSGFCVILVDTEKSTINIRRFPPHSHKIASDFYINEEKKCEKKKGCEVAMVSVDDISNLKNAYPAFFLDTRTFLNNLSRFIF
ncbi:GTP pyrophosphokinase yjbM [Yersinia rohdei]|uniref:RelA/SpoT domain-containing protein n=1 Tax=Yersinia rohdei TaxID=29485 RepID=UPI0005E163A0|nr:RelA/SpoT domain-containing protein [Yersinia rohdei]CND91998.1 GTP pyrophosphokinase yjbM [Yersinia rohdei]CQJ56487.1 GTP pyrophosphokinase yjbM [Yersinia rohdei]